MSDSHRSSKADRRQLHLRRDKTDIQYHLWRLTEEEYRQLRSNSLPIKRDGGFFIQFMLSEHGNPDRLTLPKAFLSLESSFGKTSDWFDDWKGSFYFPLLLAVKKPVGQLFYLMSIYDHRGCLEYLLYHILENGIEGHDVDIYHQPFEHEFSREEINEFIVYLYGYLVGVTEILVKLPIQSFLKHIDSNHILYGYRDGDFFEEEIKLEEEYKAAIQAFEETHGSTLHEKNSNEIKQLLHYISDEVF